MFNPFSSRRQLDALNEVIQLLRGELKSKQELVEYLRKRCDCLEADRDALQRQLIKEHTGLDVQTEETKDGSRVTQIVDPIPKKGNWTKKLAPSRYGLTANR